MTKALIQSYVMQKWFVSTIHRQSSVMTESPPWYYETIIWEWDAETRKTGAIVSTEDSGSWPEVAAKRHATICVNLVKGAAPHD